MKKIILLFFTFFFGIFHEAASQEWVYLDSINTVPLCIEPLNDGNFVLFSVEGYLKRNLVKIKADGTGGDDVLVIANNGVAVTPICCTYELIKSFSEDEYLLMVSRLDLNYPYKDEVVLHKFDSDLNLLAMEPIEFGFFSPLEIAVDAVLTSDTTITFAGYVQESGSQTLLVFQINRNSKQIIWQKVYQPPPPPGSYNEVGTRIIPDLSGGFFIVGRNGGNFPVFVKRITALGDEIWTKYYEGTSEADAVHGGDSSIVITSSGTIFKIDYEGDILWKHEVLGCPGETCYFCRKIRKTPDGRYVTIGLKGSYENGQVVDYIGVYFYSEAGEILEKYFFGGTSIYSYQPIDFAPTDDGEYIIVSRLLGDGSMHVMKTNIKDFQSPLAGFSYQTENLEAFFSDTSVFNPTSWHWDFGDGDTSALQHPSHGYAEEGMYEVCLIASNLNGSDTVCQWVELEVSSTITLPQRSRNLTLFPNPAGDELNLRVSPPLAENGEFRLYNVLGQLVKKHPLAAGKNEYRFSLHPLPPACYYYSLSTGQEALALGKILKQ